MISAEAMRPGDIHMTYIWLLSSLSFPLLLLLLLSIIIIISIVFIVMVTIIIIVIHMINRHYHYYYYHKRQHLDYIYINIRWYLSSFEWQDNRGVEYRCRRKVDTSWCISLCREATSWCDHWSSYSYRYTSSSSIHTSSS